MQLKNNQGVSLAHLLAVFDNTWQTGNIEILKIGLDEGNVSVAHLLAGVALYKNWITKEKEILSLQTDDGVSVAHFLAKNNLSWTTNDEGILSLKTKHGESVADILAKRSS